MRIVLIYPPPWKIPKPGETSEMGTDGPPGDHHPGDLDADLFQVPYGLLSMASQAMSRGVPVKVLNLSAFPWSEVESLLQELRADLFGLSCWTANRRGVGLVAQCIRRHQPRAHILVGGPHATSLGPEMLRHHQEIDTVVLGEGEATFVEIVAQLERGQLPVRIAGTVYRDPKGKITKAPPRPAIADLDTLSSPHKHFDTHVVMTSRGCPFSCTFCGAEASWGKGFRSHSESYVLDQLEQAVARLPVKMITIKDDTFTANRSRALSICRGIRQRQLGFIWSCDTRGDLLSDELLREMRLAGCERLSVGLESGSPEVLRRINKRISPDQILESTELAKRYGIKVRYYAMLGNRGETADTFRETLRFLELAQPHEYIFSCLSIYPGTRDFQDAEAQGWLDREVFFTETFQELKTPFDATDEDLALMTAWFQKNKGLTKLYRPTVQDHRDVLERLGDHHAAHLDLGGALFHQAELEEAEHHIRKAIDLGYPLPGVAYSYLACIAAKRRDLRGMQDHLTQGATVDPQHVVLIQNIEAVKAWLARGGPVKGLALDLLADHDFQLLERTKQPMLPGPLPESTTHW